MRKEKNSNHKDLGRPSFKPSKHPFYMPSGVLKNPYLAIVEYCDNALTVSPLDLSLLWKRNQAEKKAEGGRYA